MRVRNFRIWGQRGLLALLMGAVMLPAAWAVPSFSRQTGLPCNVCHITPPELTQFGRQFKLNGYTMTGMKQIAVKASGGTAGLSINEALPISAMVQVADTAMGKPLQGTQNNNAEFPQQFSLFLAGALAPHIGSFIQVTYSGPGDHLGMDNTDFRVANQGTLAGKSVIYGATLNNNPTVEDIYNDTPAWGFPWISPDNNNGPNAAPFIQGALATDVLGLGGYAMYDNHLYGDFTLYRSAHLGQSPTTGNGFQYNIARSAPYWRAAWQQNIGNATLEVGTFGMHVNSFPQAISGSTDQVTDKALDFQLDAPFDHNSLTFNGVYTDETSNLYGSVAAGSASNVSGFLHNTQLNGTYHFGDRVTAGLGYFNQTGTSDALLYPSGTAETGSANNSPANSGWIVQGGYWLDQNIELTAQYTAYHKFNGGTSNYDGLGRNASDNNTVYLMAWFLF